MTIELCDVNVLLYAFRAESDRHEEYRGWLSERLDDGKPFGLSELVLSSLVRLVTNPRIFDPPASPAEAFRFTGALRAHPETVVLTPGAGHWVIFERLCLLHGLHGGDVMDGYLAALALEHGAVWLTADRGFGRFDGLEVRHPLDDA